MTVSLRSVALGLVALVVALVLAAVTAVGWEVILGPRARATTAEPFAVTDARLARGKYLVEGVAACLHCHTEHDFTNPDYPIIQAKKGAGWTMPIPELGVISARNITPDPETGLGGWTDDEIARAIREGVRKDGSALFPLMPYTDFAVMTDEDVAAIVVYMRTLAPVKQTLPERDLPFPLGLLVNTMPTPLSGPRPSHPSSTREERGQYLTRIAGCEGCHTAADAQGQPLPGMAFGGGGQFHDPGLDGKAVFSLNITQDPSGIPHYDEAMFVDMMRSGRLQGRTLNHIMPFEFFRNMTDEDLGDIFAFIKSRPPVKHRISNTDAPTMCPVCNQSHGLGELNAKAGS